MVYIGAAPCWLADKTAPLQVVPSIRHIPSDIIHLNDARHLLNIVQSFLGIDLAVAPEDMGDYCLQFIFSFLCRRCRNKFPSGKGI